MPHGSKLWRYKYRYLGKEKRLALGSYNEVSLVEAREKRAEARKSLSKGLDPSFTRKEQKRQKTLNAENTFETIAREWHINSEARWSDIRSNAHQYKIVNPLCA